MERKGFNLVEIMIVVAIIFLLAAIAVPSLMNAKKQVNAPTAKPSVIAVPGSTATRSADPIVSTTSVPAGAEQMK